MSSANSSGATPNRLPLIGRIGWLQAAVGGFLGILATGWISWTLLGANPQLAWLIASLGASAVLVFALPASPLSQPWPVFGGHVIAAAVGIACHALFTQPWLAGAAAVGGAIALTSLTRSLHAPAGGTALLAAIPSPAVAALGWHLIFVPVALNAALLVLCAVAWHRLSGHSYPHRAVQVPPVPAWSGHIADADLDHVLAEWDEVLDVSREDLLAILHSVEARVRARQVSRSA